jgi:hypothetical protein
MTPARAATTLRAMRLSPFEAPGEDACRALEIGELAIQTLEILLAPDATGPSNEATAQAGNLTGKGTTA